MRLVLCFLSNADPLCALASARLLVSFYDSCSQDCHASPSLSPPHPLVRCAVRASGPSPGALRVVSCGWAVPSFGVMVVLHLYCPWFFGASLFRLLRPGLLAPRGGFALCGLLAFAVSSLSVGSALRALALRLAFFLGTLSLASPWLLCFSFLGRGGSLASVVCLSLPFIWLCSSSFARTPFFLSLFW